MLRIIFIMIVFPGCCLPGIQTIAQQTNPTSPMDALSFGVVMDDPGMKKVIVKQDITYLEDAKGSLHMDLYLPPGITAKEKRPAIIFLNAIGDQAGERKVKSWGIYSTWPKLMASYGYIGISMEADGDRIPESLRGLFNFLTAKGSNYNIDADRLGVYAASANVGRSAEYLMSKEVVPGIKAAVLYYGSTPEGPYRKDLPVLFVVSEGDVQRNGYQALWEQVLKNNAPWTITMGTGMPHAFDAYSDNDAARKIIRETIAFWKNNLDPVPATSVAHSKGRDVLGNIQMDRPKAVATLQSLATEYPNDVRVQSFYADLLREDQRYDEAETLYKKVLAVDPTRVDIILSMASLYYAQQKPAEAERYVEQAAQSGLMKRRDYANLGFRLLVAGKDKEAAIYYEKALEMEPRGVDYYNLACAYAKINSSDKALQALTNAIKYGYNSKQQFENDPDLTSLKNDERFKTMVAKLR
jgi:tetratricopeptide (TPR) repeat protein